MNPREIMRQYLSGLLDANTARAALLGGPGSKAIDIAEMVELDHQARKCLMDLILPAGGAGRLYEVVSSPQVWKTDNCQVRPSIPSMRGFNSSPEVIGHLQERSRNTKKKSKRQKGSTH